jgi:hypothetical protein
MSAPGNENGAPAAQGRDVVLYRNEGLTPLVIKFRSDGTARWALILDRVGYANHVHV